MSVSWRLEAECSSFSFLQGDALSVRPAPPWRQAPVRSPVLDRPLRAFGTLSPQTNCRTLAMPAQERAWPPGSRRIGRSNSFMDLNTRTRMIPAAFIQVRQQGPSHSVLLTGVNVASIYATCRIVLLLFVLACLRTWKSCLRVFAGAGEDNCLQGPVVGGASVCTIHKIFWLILMFACLQAESVFAFNYGDRVQSTTAGLNIHSSATLNSGVIAQANLGDTGTVQGGPYYDSVSGYTFYYVAWDTHSAGYSVQNYLQLFTQPNLTPYQPSGWSDKIVVTRTAGSTTDSTSLTTADTLYVNAAVINNGTAATAINFNNEFYVDGVGTTFWVTTAPLNVNSYSYLTTGYSIGQLSAGTHTIKITADNGGVIAESNEGDNSYTKTITVSNPAQPNLTPYQPSGWSDKIVVSRIAGSTTDSTSLTTADTLYVNAAVINNGTAATAVNFQNALFVDGVEATYWVTTAPLNVNSYSYLCSAAR